MPISSAVHENRVIRCVLCPHSSSWSAPQHPYWPLSPLQQGKHHHISTQLLLSQVLLRAKLVSNANVEPVKHIAHMHSQETRGKTGILLVASKKSTGGNSQAVMQEVRGSYCEESWTQAGGRGTFLSMLN